LPPVPAVRWRGRATVQPSGSVPEARRVNPDPRCLFFVLGSIVQAVGEAPNSPSTIRCGCDPTRTFDQS
jgi:hypothetical protein